MHQAAQPLHVAVVGGGDGTDAVANPVEGGRVTFQGRIAASGDADVQARFLAAFNYSVIPFSAQWRFMEPEQGGFISGPKNLALALLAFELAWVDGGAATGAGEVWVTHGQEDALVHWCKTKGLAARPLDLVGYGDEDEHETPPAGEAEA